MVKATCKTCHEEKDKATSYTRKAKQVNCDDCLEKAKSRRTVSTRERMAMLEKENEDLRKKLDKEVKDKYHYQEKLEEFAEKYVSLCVKVGDLTLKYE